MKIYRPIRTNNKTQAFGENLACAKVTPLGGLVDPVQVLTAGTHSSAPGTCPAGYKPFYPLIGMRGHNGEDWAAYRGEPIFFPVDIPGIDWEAATEVDDAGGIGVRVRSVQPVPLEHLPPQAGPMIKKQYSDNGAVRLIFLFWHLQKVDVYDKKPIKFGDRIGWANSTGASSGDHVHFSMKVSDLQSWFTIDSDNGYTGACDFKDWFENKFVLDVISERQTDGLGVADRVAVIAAQKQAEGNGKLAAQLWAIVSLIKAFLKGDK